MPSRRVPGTRLAEYLELAKLLRRRRAGAASPIRSRCQGPLWERLIEPFLVAALNIEAPEGSAALAGQVVRETLAAGGRNYHPLIAARGPVQRAGAAGARLSARRAARRSRFGRRLRAFAFDGDRATRPRFRRRADRAWRGRERRAGDAAAGDRAAAAGRYDADGVPLHRQRALPHRAAAGPAADHRHRRRPRAMAVRVSRAAVGDDQRRRRLARHAARGTGAAHLGATSPRSRG